jgi:hypothetical protein
VHCGNRSHPEGQAIILGDFDKGTAVLPTHAIGLRCALNSAEGDGGALRGEPCGHVAEAEVVVGKLVGVGSGGNRVSHRELETLAPQV